MGSSVNVNPSLFRSESLGYYYDYNYYPDQNQNYTMMEKRQLFLRSYQFCQKKSLTERIKGSLIRAKKVLFMRLWSSRGLTLKRLVFFPRFRCAFYYRRRRFSRLLNRHNRSKSDSSSSCFW